MHTGSRAIGPLVNWESWILSPAVKLLTPVQQRTGIRDALPLVPSTPPTCHAGLQGQFYVIPTRRLMQVRGELHVGVGYVLPCTASVNDDRTENLKMNINKKLLEEGIIHLTFS
jgi:hypothetical protein